VSLNNRLSKYATLVFDCDGVVLNSNQIKTEAFYQAALPYGVDSAEAFLNYHVSNGGVSRYKKFVYFLDHLVPGRSGPGLDDLLNHYTSELRKNLIGCEVASGLKELRKNTPDARWLIVSGGDQAELRDVFIAKKLDLLFDGGIFGSPDTKDEIITRELACENIKSPALFLGDSQYDYQAANTAGLNFIFLSQWSEVPNWRDWCASNDIDVCLNISTLFD